MHAVADAWQVIDSLRLRTGAEPGALADAGGRVLAESVTAKEDQPAFDRSAMDGFCAGPGAARGHRLRLVGEVPMGSSAPVGPRTGEALRVFTGSALPVSRGGIVRWEDVREDADGALELLVDPSERWVRTRGSHARRGQLLLEAGAVLNAGALTLLAGAGITRPLVAVRPSVAHLVTGRELVPPDCDPPEGCVRDCNSTLIGALLLRHGAARAGHAVAGEDAEGVHAALGDLLAGRPHLVLISGGSSRGEHDHTAAALEAAGFRLHINGVRTRPGKPLILAEREGTVAFGLPGNPVSHFVCFHLFVARALAVLTGARRPELARVPLTGEGVLRADERETWWPAQLGPDGCSPLRWSDSSDLNCLAEANCLLRVPPGGLPGPMVEILLIQQ